MHIEDWLRGARKGVRVNPERLEPRDAPVDLYMASTNRIAPFSKRVAENRSQMVLECQCARRV